MSGGVGARAKARCLLLLRLLGCSHWKSADSNLGICYWVQQPLQGWYWARLEYDRKFPRLDLLKYSTVDSVAVKGEVGGRCYRSRGHHSSTQWRYLWPKAKPGM